MARISDYAVIGDCHTVALVGRDASIDWWCPERFDSPSVFARLLDPDAGHCSIRIDGQSSSSRAYVQDTNVLTTTLSNTDGDLEVTDCMPVAAFDPTRPAAVDAAHCILRRLRCLSGHVEVHVEVVVRPDYARAEPDAAQTGLVSATATHPLSATDHGYRATWTLSAGESAWLRIDGPAATAEPVAPHDAADALAVAICHVHSQAPARVAGVMGAAPRKAPASWRQYRVR